MQNDKHEGQDNPTQHRPPRLLLRGEQGPTAVQRRQRGKAAKGRSWMGQRGRERQQQYSTIQAQLSRPQCHTTPNPRQRTHTTQLDSEGKRTRPTNCSSCDVKRYWRGKEKGGREGVACLPTLNTQPNTQTTKTKLPSKHEPRPFAVRPLRLPLWLRRCVPGRG
jgi:hypothetical protein